MPYNGAFGLLAIETYTLAQLAALQDSPDRWVYKPMLQAPTRVILFGDGNVGKSLLAFDLALSTAAGTPFLGCYAPNPVHVGPVLVFSTEGDIYANRDRLLWLCNAHGAPLDAPLYYVQEPPIFDDAKDRQAFWDLLHAVRPKLVVLDPLDSFFWGDENSPTETKTIRHFLNAVVREFSCTLLVVHHASAKNDSKRPRGTTAWYGWADTVIQVTQKVLKTKAKRVSLELVKQRNGPTGMLLQVRPRIDDREGLITFEVEGAEPPAGLAVKVVEVLQGHGPQSFSAIREATGGRSGTLRLALDLLEQAQTVVHTRLAVPCGVGRTRIIPAWRHVNDLDAPYTVAAPEGTVPGGDPSATDEDDPDGEALADYLMDTSRAWPDPNNYWCVAEAGPDGGVLATAAVDDAVG